MFKRQPKPPRYTVTQPDLCVSVMAHQGGKEIFNRHIPFWLQFGGKVVVWSPADDRISIEGHESMALGKKGHDGIEALSRFKYMINFLSQSAYKRHIIFEYDSLSLSTDWPLTKENEIGCMMFSAEPNETYKGSMFSHPPIYIYKQGLEQVWEKLKHIPNNDEGGMWDRAAGRAVEEAGLKVVNFLKKKAPLIGFSRNTIYENEVPVVKKAVKDGATVFHGIKSREVLVAIMEGRR